MKGEAPLSARESEISKKRPQTYPVPGSYLNGDLAFMLLWDVFYYLLATRGETNREGHHFVETDFLELIDLTGLNRRSIREQLNLALQANEPYRLVEDGGIKPRSRVLKLCQYKELMAAEKILVKPAGFIENHWAWALNQPYPKSNKTSRLPLALINLLLLKPPGRLTDRLELIKRVRHPKAVKPPDAGVVNEALDHLIQLRLIEQDGTNQFYARRDQFKQPARVIWQQLQRESRQSDELEVLRLARQLDAERAALAYHLAELGRFNLEQYFYEIFYSLAQLRLESDLPFLEYVVQRQRHKPPLRQRWQECLQAFERHLLRQSRQLVSTKVKLELDKGRAEGDLSLPGTADGARLRWGKLVLWYEDRRFAFSGLPSAGTQVSLCLDGDLVWQRTLSYEDNLIRADLTANLKVAGSHAVYRLIAEPQGEATAATLSAMVEVQYLMEVIHDR